MQRIPKDDVQVRIIQYDMSAVVLPTSKPGVPRWKGNVKPSFGVLRSSRYIYIGAISTYSPTTKHWNTYSSVERVKYQYLLSVGQSRFVVKHKPGIDNPAHYLSRKPICQP